MPASYDAIVLGIGGVGSAALWQLARRGARVLGIDRFAPPHDRGSSHGQTRIIRQAYFEHPDYVPLLLRGYELWHELEGVVGTSLLRETGLLQVGPADGVVVPGVIAAAMQHRLSVESLSATEIERRWPAVRVSPELVGVYEKRAGYLRVEACIAACLDAARRAAADVLTNVEVLDWRAGEDLRVTTTAGEFTAGRLVIAAGAWASRVLHGLNVPLEVRRKVITWHAANDRQLAADRGFPCFLFEAPLGVFYGFPAIDERGLKVGNHLGGEVVADPLKVDRALHASDQEPIKAFLRAHMPSVDLQPSSHAVCLYTMSPDEHFLVDRDPTESRVAFAAGLSGHGYKFAPVLGAALADLALDGHTKLPIEFLSLKRFADR